MDSLWISVVILMNGCFSSCIFILVKDKTRINSIKLDGFMLMSISWLFFAGFFVWPHLAPSFLYSSSHVTIFFAIIILSSLTAGYHLFSFLKTHPHLIRLSVISIISVGILSFLYNFFYSLTFSYILFHLSSLILFGFSILLLFHSLRFEKLHTFSLSATFVIGGNLLQLSTVFFDDLLHSQLMMVMSMVSIPCILYGFSFMSIDFFSKLVDRQNHDIEKKNQALVHANKELHVIRNYDDMTGLKNKLHFEMDVKNIQIQKNMAWAALLNVDNFKTINQALGYEKGDAVIKAMGLSIGSLSSSSLNVYRLFGDRFAFLFSGSKDNLFSLSQTFQNQLSDISKSMSLPMNLSASIGITEVNPSKNLDTIFQELNLSMSTVSLSSKKGHALYHPRILEDFLEKTAFNEQLQAATKNEEWCLYFQPQVTLPHQKICGAEILVRWKTKEGELLSPGNFLPIAESIGLMKDIGNTLIKKSFQTIENLNALGYDHLRYAINLSESQFWDNALFEKFCALKKIHNIPDGQIVLEIVESIFIENFYEVHPLLSKFSKQGFDIALDDFGTGYSSLQYLAELPVQEIKFDKFFAKSLPHSLRTQKVLSAFIRLTDELGLRHVIEGVETLQEFNLVSSLGGRCYQGYCFSKPVDLQNFERILTLSHLAHRPQPLFEREDHIEQNPPS